MPELRRDAGGAVSPDAIAEEDWPIGGAEYRVRRYRPRTEGLFARVERWTRVIDGDIHWRGISPDNLVTFYGLDADSRVADPLAPHRVFSWLVCSSFDGRGQAIRYLYKREDSAGVDVSQAHEGNRAAGRHCQLYPLKILYGNAAPTPDLAALLPRPTLAGVAWLFEVAFDYGEGYLPGPSPSGGEALDFDPAPAGAWAVRPDPFSHRRAGFEVRTYRRCRRVLMVHHFPDELGTPDCLVASLDLTYDDSPYGSAVASVTRSGYVRRADGSYLRRGMPPLELEYTRSPLEAFAAGDSAFRVRSLDPAAAATLPGGRADPRHRWADLDGEGIPGLLSEDAGHWYYRPNRGGGAFGPARPLAAVPAGASLAGGQALLDVAGDGSLDLVDFADGRAGYSGRADGDDWEPFRAFDHLPAVDWRDPNLRLVDLTGDGHADVLVTADDGFTWFPSLAEGGFDAPRVVRSALTEEDGPRLVFADGRGAVFLADMTGDGLSDLVRLGPGQVCYWPNVGYGRFGAKVAMDDAPALDPDGAFDHRRVHLFDADGSGPTDLVYEGADGVEVYLNQCGNRWSAARRFRTLPPCDSASRLDAVDLLGLGTACLVRSKPLPGDRDAPVAYLDLMGGVKPRLLTRVTNNLGAETRVEYASSTRFYLDDLARGRPWVTRLPFPVHVVTRVETRDLVAGNRLVSTFAYSHGHYDGVEREFRGFGRVEQLDAEQIGAAVPPAANEGVAAYVPPVRTVTWFHTGPFADRGRLTRHFEGEYFREGLETLAAADGLFLPDSTLPARLTADEEREACRALRGSVLRQEVYADDGGGKAGLPYSTSERNYAVVCVQPRGVNRHAVFFAHPREQLDAHYERAVAPGTADPPAFDPRVTHALTLAVGRFGQVERSAAVAYPRRPAPGRLPEQEQLHVALTVGRFAHRDGEADWYRVGLPVETRSFEWVLPPGPGPDGRYAFDDLRARAAGLLPEGAMEPDAGKGWPAKFFDWRDDPAQRPTAATAPPASADGLLRPTAAARTVYRSDDLTGPLPPGVAQSLALPFETYRLAFTPDLLESADGHFTDARLADARYAHSEGDANWWVPSGRVFYSPGAADTPAQERAYARAHFFRPVRSRDPFHTAAVPTEGRVRYDAYDLLAVEGVDALGNTVSAGERDAGGAATRPALDYRVLQARVVSDPNRNRTAVAFDALGLVVGTAVMGKPGEVAGDSLDGFDADPPEAAVLAHLRNPLGDPACFLGRATARFVYDLFAWRRTRTDPACVYSAARETHASDVPAGGATVVRQRFAYSDGFGREVQAKGRAKPGPVPLRDPATGRVRTADGVPVVSATPADPRWVGTGWTVFNNKGDPVRKFEPFFTDTERYEADVRVGVGAVVLYDPVGRVVATLHPDHTWQKVVFDPWRQASWDGNDTVRWATAPGFETDPRRDPDVGAYFGRLPAAEFLPTWFEARRDGSMGVAELRAATGAAAHAETPLVTHLDSLGRAVRTTQYFTPVTAAAPETATTRVTFDAEGRQRAVTDARGRAVMRADFDMLGRPTRQRSVDSGTTYTLADAAGQPAFARDALGREFRTLYDPLRRPVAVQLREAGAAGEVAIEQRVYGESLADPEPANARGKAVAVRDQGGAVETPQYDFKGNPKAVTRRFAAEFRTPLDWAGLPALEADEFTGRTEFDALNRPRATTTPDGSRLNLTYGADGRLDGVRGVLAGSPGVTTVFVSGIDHDAKGQRTRIAYGNGAATAYDYDPLTYRLRRLVTRRPAAGFPDDDRTPPPAGFPGQSVQNLSYTYDPVGNVTAIRDDAQQAVFFANRRVEPSCEYTYDAAYRLTEATGREHCGQSGGVLGGPTPADATNGFQANLAHPGDGQALDEYVERYVYDLVGNFVSMRHATTNPIAGTWTRSYTTDPDSNRLLETAVTGGLPESFTYDAAGNTFGFGHLADVTYDHHNQMRTSVKESGVGAETTHYVYDAGGQRVRKVTTDAAGAVRHERRYVGGYEVYREYLGDGRTVKLERTTLPVMDDATRIALVETRTLGDDGTAKQLIRYQHGNHLGTVSLELDAAGRVITYEEYTPYGSTSYQAVNAAVNAAAKRYRYTGKERDDETGFNYHGARYCAPWLGRWTTADPAGLVDGPNVYGYCSGNPVALVDPTGTDDIPADCQANKCHPTEKRATDWKNFGSMPPPTLEQMRDIKEGTRQAADDKAKEETKLLHDLATADADAGTGTVCQTGCHALRGLKNVHGNPEQMNKDATLFVKSATMPLMVLGGAQAVVARGVIGGLVVPMIGGAVGGKAAHATAKALGASDDAAAFAGFAGGLVGGGLAARLPVPQL